MRKITVLSFKVKIGMITKVSTTTPYSKLCQKATENHSTITTERKEINEEI